VRLSLTTGAGPRDFMSWQHSYHRIISGEAIGLGPAAARAALALSEPMYAAAVRARNRGFDRNPAKVCWLPRPVISVGNITAGGTGKTPIVRWLASRLRDAGRRVAVLSRGYKAAPGSLGDEQRMLDALLNEPGKPPVLIRANPDRFAAGTTALGEHPAIDVFLLDDGFQHRRLGRDLDVVLINAIEPFGHGHVLPRGLLREPLSGLARAGAIVLTHASSVDDAARSRIVRQVRRYAPDVPVYQCDHAPARLKRPSPAGKTELAPDELGARRVFAFCGIGSPRGFERQVRSLAGSLSGNRWFPDHHPYTAAELGELRTAARTTGADVLVTTEKDWVKLAALDAAAAKNGEIPIWRLDVEARFREDGEERLLQQVLHSLARARRRREGAVG
jgi:tetraacyldisaccharide 4'-kinase